MEVLLTEIKCLEDRHRMLMHINHIIIERISFTTIAPILDILASHQRHLTTKGYYKNGKK